MKIETNFEAVVNRRREAMVDLEKIVTDDLFAGCPTPIDGITIGPFSFEAKRDGETVNVVVSDGVAEFRMELDLNGENKDRDFECEVGFLFDAMAAFADRPYNFDLAKSIGL